MPQPKYTKTVHDFTDPTKRKHFVLKKEAIDYANGLLEQGHKVKIFDYQPPTKRYIDYLAAQDGPQ